MLIFPVFDRSQIGQRPGSIAAGQGVFGAQQQFPVIHRRHNAHGQVVFPVYSGIVQIFLVHTV